MKTEIVTTDFHESELCTHCKRITVSRAQFLRVRRHCPKCGKKTKYVTAQLVWEVTADGWWLFKNKNYRLMSANIQCEVGPGCNRQYELKSLENCRPMWSEKTSFGSIS